MSFTYYSIVDDKLIFLKDERGISVSQRDMSHQHGMQPGRRDVRGIMRSKVGTGRYSGTRFFEKKNLGRKL